ncbi:MAG: type I phosphomannose isomerase catalytic subunit [Fibrobacterota bacterium]
MNGLKAYPLRFEPVYQERIWGGRLLETRFKKSLPPGKKIGESWELSPHRTAGSVIANGAYHGETLAVFTARFPEQVLGSRIAALTGNAFPLLFKFIDANDRLSIQVHPGDAYAKANENDLGKTEAWIVLGAAPGAKLICGLRNRLTRADVEAGVRNNTLETMLNEFPVREGDCIFVPAGTVHAIEAGCLIYEVQQASDVTYRLYDWGRLGDDGKPRALHVEKSLSVMDYHDIADHRTHSFSLMEGANKRIVLAACGYFAIERFDIWDVLFRPLDSGFEVVTVIAGSGRISGGGHSADIAAGDTVLVPAACESYNILPHEGALQLFITFVPESKLAYAEALLKSGADQDDIKALGGLI